MFHKVKLKYFISILFLKLLIITSSGKLVFQRVVESNIDIMKYFFEKDFFNSSRFHLIIIPLNYATINPYAFTKLMVNLNRFSRNTVMVLDNVTVDNVMTGENFLLLQTGEKIDPLLTVLESIGKDIQFSFRRVLVWFEDIKSKKIKSKIKMKTATANINEAIILNPILKSDGIKGINKPWKVTEEVRLDVKNVLLSKKNPVINSVVGYTTNKTIIRKTIQKAKQQLGVFQDQLRKQVLKVLLFLRPMSAEKHVRDNKTSYKGIDISLLKAISKYLNVSYELIIGNASEYGTIYENGSYTRAFNDTLNRKVDMCINRFPVDESAPGIVAIPYDRDKFCFVIRRPKSHVRAWSIFVSFSDSVWFAIMGIYVGIYIIFLIFKEPHWKSITFIESILASPQLQVTRESRRVFWGSWLLFVVMVTNTFISLYVTQLLPKRTPPTIRSIKRLVELNFTLLTETGYFNSFHPSLINMTLTPYYGHAQDIDDKTALLTSALTRIKLNHMFPLEFEIVNDCLKERFVGPLISTSHIMYSPTGIVINRILSAGQLKFWVTNYLNTNEHLPEHIPKPFVTNDRKHDEPINMTEIKFIFKYTAFGLIAAAMIFICELVYFKLVTVFKDKVTKSHTESIQVTYKD